jgi:hypothetical protein
MDYGLNPAPRDNGPQWKDIKSRNVRVKRTLVSINIELVETPFNITIRLYQVSRGDIAVKSSACHPHPASLEQAAIVPCLVGGNLMASTLVEGHHARQKKTFSLNARFETCYTVTRTGITAMQCSRLDLRALST